MTANSNVHKLSEIMRNFLASYSESQHNKGADKGLVVEGTKEGRT